MAPPTSATKHGRTLAPESVAQIDGWFRAANYLSVGQIYLLSNPLLREPLSRHHVKPRLLGHFGTAPGLNLVYAHMNRAIRERDLGAIYVTGPGHGSSRSREASRATSRPRRRARSTRVASSATV